MGYIIKDTQGLVITRLTDVGRRKISQGNFNISYFQVGDSEINYTAITDYDFSNSMVLEPQYNSSNNSGLPASTKNDVKYPFILQGVSGNTYGTPYQASSIEEVYNTAAPLGLFSADTSNNCYFPNPSIDYVISSRYTLNLTSSSFQGNSRNYTGIVSLTTCEITSQTIDDGQYATIFMRGQSASNLCGCINSCYPILTYKIISTAAVNTGVLDRNLPNLSGPGSVGFTNSAKMIVYPSGMTYYDLSAPLNYWSDSVINYESVCPPEDGIVKVWNMNIPWSESPAGIVPGYLGYENFKSVDYISLKEYYGYMSSDGQTDTSGTWYYNSFGEKVDVLPEDQKAISIVHYSNNAIVNFYGEKFATEVYDSTDPGGTGQARNFKIVLPWLMWHKNDNCCNGATFYIDPPGFDNFNLLKPYYIQSKKNSDMNNPGIRYYHLYDTNEAYPDGPPNRVGKVFPDDKIIIFDDEEIIAAMTWVSNRNFTLPAPKLGLISPSSCGGGNDGILDNDQECLWVTYGFGGPWQGMHCNYYQKIIGPSDSIEKNVVVTFGGDFNCMNAGRATSGFCADEFFVLIQKTPITQSRPDPTAWEKVDFTFYLSTNGYIDGITGKIYPSAFTDLTFIITNGNYQPYDLSNQISLPTSDDVETYLYFGEEYFFYGTIETDIEATIYEMKYLINLPSNQFVNSSNPSWSQGQTPYMTEIGLYDNDKNLLVLSKFQSPQIREGIQQAVVKLDF